VARENFVLMHGQVRGDPRITINNDGEIIKAMFTMRVLRRPTTNAEMSGKLQIDCPVVYTRNADMAKQIQNLRDGDMVDIRGAISSRECRKSTICPECGTKNIKDGNIVYVTPIYMCQRGNVDDKTGLALLKERAEISNLVNVIGNLCRDPDYYVDASNRKYAQYQLAVNRRYRIKEDMEEVRTDYPWVKTFGMQAYNDSEGLHTGSCVYISGAIQTREIERSCTCGKCGAEYKWKDSAAEIVPYYIGYLANCTIPEVNEEVQTEDGEETQCSEQAE
jgi:single-stranded DNA-binding protein